jgi:hypothetical protein
VTPMSRFSCNVLPFVEAFEPCTHKYSPRAGGLHADTLQYFSVDTQSETFGEWPGIAPVLSMLCDV